MKERRYSPITELHRNWQAYGRQTARGVLIQHKYRSGGEPISEFMDAHPSVPDTMMRIKPTNRRAAYQGYRRQLRDINIGSHMGVTQQKLARFQSTVIKASGVCRTRLCPLLTSPCSHRTTANCALQHSLTWASRIVSGTSFTVRRVSTVEPDARPTPQRLASLAITSCR
jgi:hypothetical protein